MNDPEDCKLWADLQLHLFITKSVICGAMQDLGKLDADKEFCEDIRVIKVYYYHDPKGNQVFTFRFPGMNHTIILTGK
jgi:hypothetical protein